MSGSKSKKIIREEARAWVRRLKDVHTAEDRKEFQHWLSENPAHEPVYREVESSYDRSGLLRTSKISREWDLDSVFSRPNFAVGRGVAAAAIAGLLLVGGYELSRQLRGLRPVALESTMLSSGEKGRSIMLADGSTMSMAPSSEVRIELSWNERRAELRRGRVRLNIAKEARLFHIAAGTSSTEASAGVVEAAIINGHGIVSRSDVRPPDGSTNPSVQRSELVTPGVVANQQTVEFSSVPLGQAIERVNEVRGGHRIELDPSLADLRVTGVFQRGDTETIARSLALAFGLKLTSTASGTVLLSPRK